MLNLTPFTLFLFFFYGFIKSAFFFLVFNFRFLLFKNYPTNYDYFLAFYSVLSLSASIFKLYLNFDVFILCN